MVMKKKKAINLTEKANPHSIRIDSASPLEIVRTMNREDEKVVRAVRGQLKAIAKAI
jgi:N-acetylmuramic acid 6-phosphate etherase